MKNLRVKEEIYESLVEIAHTQDVKLDDLTNAMLERQLRTGGVTLSESIPDFPTIEKFVIAFLKFSAKDQQRFLALYDQVKMDPKRSNQLIESLRKC